MRDWGCFSLPNTAFRARWFRVVLGRNVFRGTVGQRPKQALDSGDPLLSHLALMNLEIKDKASLLL